MNIFAWDIHYSCNYHCPYCWFLGQLASEPKPSAPGDIERLAQAWDRVSKRYGRAHILIVGGEPFTYPGFMELIARLQPLHKLTIQTNFAWDAQVFLDKVRPQQDFRLSLSFHPYIADFEVFLKKALLLKSNGFNVDIGLVAWPPNFDAVLEYGKKFAAAGFAILISDFQGEYAGKKYPESYTKQQKARLIHTRINTANVIDNSSPPERTEGTLCNAGVTYAVIRENGNIYRCGGCGLYTHNKPFTNLFDPNFALLPSPEPCPAKNCPTNEWVWLARQAKAMKKTDSAPQNR